MRYYWFLILFWISCNQPMSTPTPSEVMASEANIMILGIAQDAGYPQANCKKSCCVAVWNKEVQREMVSCIAYVDPAQQKAWLFDATPDFKDQLFLLEQSYPDIELAGIFLTHAHIGHYTGLMHLGREAIGAKEIPVYAMPKMKMFLETNGPWSQLVQLQNIQLQTLHADSAIVLHEQLSVTPFLVPHRDEYSETVGFSIKGPDKKGLFIPDIDKWEKWDRDILKEIQASDYALLDGSFYKNGEIPGRDMSLIPHPFVEESLRVFEPLSDQDKAKVHFIHFNHTNPMLNPKSSAYQNVINSGFRISRQGKQLLF